MFHKNSDTTSCILVHKRRNILPEFQPTKRHAAIMLGIAVDSSYCRFIRS